MLTDYRFTVVNLLILLKPAKFFSPFFTETQPNRLPSILIPQLFFSLCTKLLSCFLLPALTMVQFHPSSHKKITTHFTESKHVIRFNKKLPIIKNLIALTWYNPSIYVDLRKIVSYISILFAIYFLHIK
mgnify:CR=1 FL=1